MKYSRWEFQEHTVNKHRMFYRKLLLLHFQIEDKYNDLKRILK